MSKQEIKQDLEKLAQTKEAQQNESLKESIQQKQSYVNRPVKK